jgi:hypothetical protein
MITLFTTAKPFIGNVGEAQLNALRSWKRLDSDVEVILMGEGQGYERVSRELGLLRVESVATSKEGTPLVGSLFALAEEHSRHELKAYLNCDIVLSRRFLDAVLSLPPPVAVGVSQRWDLAPGTEVDPLADDWEVQLSNLIASRATLHPPAGSDVFAYRGFPWTGLPDMAIGRAAYDNVLIQHCKLSGIPLVDLTGAASVVHQAHGYEHHPGGEAGVWKGAEAQANRALLHPDLAPFTLVDCDWTLGPHGLKMNFCRGDLARYLRSASVARPTTWAGRIGHVMFPSSRVAHEQ